MTKPSHALEGWTDHAREEYGDILERAPSDQEMRQLLPHCGKGTLQKHF
jgi:hypothetical protein